MDARKIDERVTIGAQPSAEELKELARDGFKSVVNLRTNGEDGQPLDPAAEGDAATEAGLQYVHIPVSLKTLSEDQVDRFRREMEQLPAPVYVHCRGGTRAGTLTAIYDAVRAGESGEQALARAEALDCAVEDPKVRQFISGYVDRRFEAGD